MTAEELTKALFVADQKTIARFCRTVLELDKTCSLTSKQVILVCLYDWFDHLKMFSDGQINEIISFLKVRIEDFADEHDLRTQLKTIQVVLSSYRYVSITGTDAWFDVTEGVGVAKLPRPAVTHTVCDVAALYAMIRTRLDQITKGLKHESVIQPPDGENSGG